MAVKGGLGPSCSDARAASALDGRGDDETIPGWPGKGAPACCLAGLAMVMNPFAG